MNILQDYYRFLERLNQRQSCALASFVGLLVTLALPPFNFWPAFVPAFCTAFWLWQQRQVKQGLYNLFFFQLAYNVSSLYWIAFALGVDIKQFFWLIPLAVLVLPMIMALYTCVLAIIVNNGKSSLPSQWLLFACLWSLGELARGHYLFAGFPWNLVGYGWTALPAMVQNTSLWGIYGLSFVTVLIATLPILMVDARHRKVVVGTFIGVLVLYAGGEWRLHYAHNTYHDDIYLRLVQPCIAQSLTNDRRNIDKNFADYLDLSWRPSAQPLTHILWPEAAVAGFVEYNPYVRSKIATVAPKNGYVLLGSSRAQVNDGKITTLWNGMVVFDAQSTVVAAYNKVHLVPFGEYIPLRSVLPAFIKKVTLGNLDYSSGVGLQTLNVAQTPPFSPLICYEAIFSGQVVALQQPRPQWLLNITNDAWYGDTSGPPQHLAITQVRAIEEGIPLVRVANNGISAIVDPWGRIVQSLALNQRGVIDGLLPKPLQEITVFGRYGNKPFVVFVMVLIIMLILINFFNRAQRNYGK